MARSLNYSKDHRPKPRQLSLCGGLILLLATATLYVVVAVRYSQAVPLPFSKIVGQHGSTSTSNQPTTVGDADHDVFALHPELHISRAPHTLKLDWSVTRQQHRPDGVLRDVYFINGTNEHADNELSGSPLIMRQTNSPVQR